ncbi:hydroxyacylglutathione hydrolase [Fundicoccus culcitae]|uniref:Hydroxyacylglutathione hydrolase n=1 Tax=Fundicoccus culcitae TaxID=2969821 RepID=A0ABY5P5E7_9LACT|nr:hydroxyacylglutathione hydrolase [Fundicoccus culcitae]UUX33600.1 hydroxyacylglutathione hydrolase [Fundicoccus culcitae]
MNVTPIKAFSDNYIWVIEEGEETIIVDPGEAQGVLDYFANNSQKLTAILLTHAHDDHTGGVKEILKHYPDTPVYGPQETEDIATEILKEGDTINLLNQDFNIILTAGHTAGHISYVTDNALFCGDALFAAGCGRVFTQDYQAQFDALQKFKALPDTTLVYPAHEYTVTNLKFARTIQPSNGNLIDALVKTERLTSTGFPSLPTTIGFERLINLFMQADTVEAFKKLRLARDKF